MKFRCHPMIYGALLATCVATTPIHAGVAGLRLHQIISMTVWTLKSTSYNLKRLFNCGMKLPIASGGV